MAGVIEAPPPTTSKPGHVPLVERLGLHRPELRAWALYDWANSAVVTTVIAAIFPIYFYRVAGAGLAEGVGTQRFAIATFLAMLALSVTAPLLGAIADRWAVKKKLLAAYLIAGVTATAAMFLVQEGDWLLALALFVVVELAVASTFVFYDALLPHIATHQEVDRVSTTGYALGYLGGGLLLALNLAWIEYPQWFGFPFGDSLTASQATLPTRFAFLSVAAWWLLFSIPLFLRVPEPVIEKLPLSLPHESPLQQSWSQLKSTVDALRKYKQAGRMLLAFLLYNEGIGTIIKMAAIYGAELGLKTSSIVSSMLIVQFVGIPCTVLFGVFADKLGAKRSIYLGLGVYLGIALLGYFMQSEVHFFALAILVGLVQGGTQGLSRSLFASLIPRTRSAQFFSLFALSEKLAGLLGPGLFVSIIMITGSSRYAVVSVILFFVVGGLLLSRVDVKRGRVAVEASESGLPR